MSNRIARFIAANTDLSTSECYDTILRIDRLHRIAREYRERQMAAEAANTPAETRPETREKKMQRIDIACMERMEHNKKLRRDRKHKREQRRAAIMARMPEPLPCTHVLVSQLERELTWPDFTPVVLPDPGDLGEIVFIDDYDGGFLAASGVYHAASDDCDWY